MEKKTWIIHGREGYCGDFGCCEPDAAGEAIRRRQTKGEVLTKEDIERIARNFGCCLHYSSCGLTRPILLQPPFG